MSRPTVVRRLTATLAVLAVLCLALPAGAATQHPQAGKPPGVSGTSLLDQLLLWLGIFGPGPGAGAHLRTDLSKAASTTSPLADGSTSQNVSSADASQGMDPNGSH